VNRFPNDAPTIRLADMANHYRGRDSSNAVPRRMRVLLNIAGSQIMRGHTINVGVDRLTVSVPTPIACDQECAIFFGLTIAEQLFSIIGTGRVTSCTGNDTDGYRAEMEFAVSDKKSRIAIEQLFSAQPSTRIQ
jgi:hypothetical protein